MKIHSLIFHNCDKDGVGTIDAKLTPNQIRHSSEPDTDGENKKNKSFF
jgi:hypothetical protein